MKIPSRFYHSGRAAENILSFSFISRYLFAGSFALVVVFSLFWLMQNLINTADTALDEDDPGRMLDFVRVLEEPLAPLPPEPQVRPEAPQDPPPELPPPSMEKITPGTTVLEVPAPPIEPTGPTDPVPFGHGEGEYLPIVKVQPNYPRRAITRGIEGYVIVEFTVTKSGTTRDIRVVEAVPPGIFDKASIRAASRFKYKPRVIKGQAIEVEGVQNKITFELDD